MSFLDFQWNTFLLGLTTIVCCIYQLKEVILHGPMVEGEYTLLRKVSNYAYFFLSLVWNKSQIMHIKDNTTMVTWRWQACQHLVK